MNLNSPVPKAQTKEKLLSRPSETRASDAARPVLSPELISRPSLHELATLEFYKNENWFDLMCESLFKIKTRNTTIKAEVYYGFIHFISCLYCLAVIPQQLNAAGYGSRSTVVSVAACAGVGSIICGLFSNLPFVIAPPTVVSIFLSVFLQQHGDNRNLGDMAVIISGMVLLCFGWRPLFQLAAELIPIPIQVGTAVGIGLMTALAGSTEINLVVKGKYTILDIGDITPEICISISGVLIICITMVYHVKGSFCIAVIFCSLVWWIYDNAFPSTVFAAPFADKANTSELHNSRLALLTVDLVFLYVLYLNGLVTSLSNLAHLTREDGKTPRARWIFIISGILTILAGLLSGPPMLISPESAASIKAGAKTGLSTVVCGVLFCLSVFLSPVFEAVPAAGTSPILVMIGVILFQNVSRIDWRNIVEAAPAFVVLFYIPFTYSVIQGVILGYIVYMIVSLFSGDLRHNSLNLAVLYFPSKETWLNTLRDPNFHHDEDDHDDHGGHGVEGDTSRESMSSEVSGASSRHEEGGGGGRTASSDKRTLNLSMTFDMGTPAPGESSGGGKKHKAAAAAAQGGGMFDTSRSSGNTRRSSATGRSTSTGSQQTSLHVHPHPSYDVESAQPPYHSGSPSQNQHMAAAQKQHQQQQQQHTAAPATASVAAFPAKEESKETRVPFRSSSVNTAGSGGSAGSAAATSSSTGRSSFGGGAPSAPSGLEP